MHAPLQPKAHVAPRRTVPPLVHDVIASPGRPLERSVRSFMEPRFGADFGAVPLRGAHDGRSSATPDVGAPGDRFEREADAVAGRVTAMRSVASGGHRVDLSGVRVHADDRAAQIRPRRRGRRLHGRLAHRLRCRRVRPAPSRRPRAARRRAEPRGAAARRPPAPPGTLAPRPHDVDNRRETAYDDENGDTLSFGAGGGISGAVLGRVRAWQETGWVHQKVGGSASVAHWIRTRYVFKNDPPFGDYLQLRPEGTISGRAKAEDLLLRARELGRLGTDHRAHA